MSEESKKNQSTVKTLLILGASGDLTSRLLLPGLAKLITSGRAADLNLVGSSREKMSEDEWRDRVKKAFAATYDSANEAGKKALENVESHSSYISADVGQPGVLSKLLHELPGPVAVFFALPPSVSAKSIDQLEPGDLPEGTRLVLEKPFGQSQQSAHELNTKLVALLPESNIHRVDHFLGKATVFNILGLRFANRVTEPLFNNENVAKVEIIFDEDLALEGRAGYYDQAGALRDMIQSHLLQVMAFIAMNPPATLGERDLRDHIGSVLRASRVKKDFTTSTRRARYTAGKIGDRSVPAYVDEPGVDPERGTETLAEVVIEINNARWSGVPFILRSGKGLAKPRKEAIITFKPVNHLPLGFKGGDSPDRLRIGFGPSTLQLELDVNGPGGDIFTLEQAILSANLADSGMLPYSEVLAGVLAGDPLLSVRGDIAEDSWRIVDQVLKAWENNEVPMEEYAAGSYGPASWETSRDEEPVQCPSESGEEPTDIDPKESHQDKTEDSDKTENSKESAH